MIEAVLDLSTPIRELEILNSSSKARLGERRSDKQRSFIPALGMEMPSRRHP